MAQQEVTLVVGAVDDEDSTYVNGQFVGAINQKTNPSDYWQAVRRYKLPTGLLKAGQNVVAVKNNDLRGTGGMKASLLKRKGAGSTRWLSGLYLDKPEATRRSVSLLSLVSGPFLKCGDVSPLCMLRWHLDPPHAGKRRVTVHRGLSRFSRRRGLVIWNAAVFAAKMGLSPSAKGTGTFFGLRA